MLIIVSSKGSSMTLCTTCKEVMGSERRVHCFQGIETVLLATAVCSCDRRRPS